MTDLSQKYQFDTGVYRPPSEGGSASLLVRFTNNCPWNKCTFCGMYKDKKFKLRSVNDIKKDIDAMGAIASDLNKLSWEMGFGGQLPRQVIMALINKVPSLGHQPGLATLYHWLVAGGKTAFIQDANSLIMKTDDFIEALRYLREKFPSIERVTTYARAKTLVKKTDQELRDIHRAGLNRLHLGLESGDDDLLKKIQKGATSEELILGGQKALKAGFQVSEYWMPGLGGTALWRNHARNTAHVLNEINPHYIRSRPFHSWPGTPMARAFNNGEMEMLSPHGQLLELQEMISLLEVDGRVCFDHDANYWRDDQGALVFSHDYEGYQFPDEKQYVLDRIEEGLSADNVQPVRMGM